MSARRSDSHRDLSLAEELMLLALRDERGTVAASGMFAYILGGAFLAELLLLERIRVADPRKKKVALVDRGPTGDPLLDECLDKVIRARREASLATWVTRFAGLKRLKPRLAAELCRKGILRADEESVLLLFKRRVYPEIDPGPERAIVERLRKAIMGDGGGVDSRTADLIALAQRGNLLKNVFDRADLKSRKERLKRIASEATVDRPVADAIKAVQAAVAAAA